MELRMRFFGLICSSIEMSVDPPVILKLHYAARQVEGAHDPHLEVCLLRKDIVLGYIPQMKFELDI